MRLPGVKKVSWPSRDILATGSADRARAAGSSATVKSTVTDSGSDRSTLLRPGFVIGKGADAFYAATDAANVIGSSCAVATSKIDLGAGTASKVFGWKYKGGAEQTVTMAGSDDTPAEVVTALGANAGFTRDLIASLNGNKLVVTSRRGGVGEYFQITAQNFNGQGGVAQDTFTNNSQYGGADADYRVLGTGDGGYTDYTDMLGADLVVSDTPANNLVAGWFIETQLIGLTAEAKAVLTRRGSLFI